MKIKNTAKIGGNICIYPNELISPYALSSTYEPTLSAHIVNLGKNVFMNNNVM